MGQARRDAVIFRLAPGEMDALADHARGLGLSPGQAARELVLAALGGRPAPRPVQAAVRKAAFAVIVALSPDLDEAATEELLREVFDP